MVARRIGRTNIRLMLKWFKSRRENAATVRFVEAIPTILARYGELIEKHPTAYIDETWLPVNKTAMKNVLKAAWMLATDDERREWIKIGWTLLSQFQKGVGEIPLDCKIPPKASPQEGLRILEPYLRIAKLAQAEAEVNRTEMLDFIRQNSN